MTSSQKQKFNCYIDESGDEGFAALSSPWFILAGVVVKQSDDLAVSRSVDSIKSTLRKPARLPLHWRKLKHGQKRVAIEELRGEAFICCSVAVCKALIDPEATLRNWQSLYFYTTRLLVERVSWYVDDVGGLVDLIFSNRARFPYDELKEYIEMLQDIPYPKSQVRPVISSLRSIPADQRKMLQVADVSAGSLYNALCPDAYGNYEESYFLHLCDRLYRRKGKLRSYGLKLFPDHRNAMKKYHAEYPWLKELYGG